MFIAQMKLGTLGDLSTGYIIAKSLIQFVDLESPFDFQSFFVSATL